MMKNIAALALVLLPTLVSGCATDQDPNSPDDDITTNSKFRPETCKQVADYVAGAKDGEYTLYYQQAASQSWKAYCADMQTAAPIEYLSLAQGTGLNTSMFSDATKSVVTTYEKVRIDPKSFIVDIGDTRFATSSGSVVHNNVTVNAMPFGIAMGCGATASMNINLAGTSFRLEGALPQFGTNVHEDYDLTGVRQVLDTTVTGDCGWVAQDKYANPIMQGSQPSLVLNFAVATKA